MRARRVVGWGIALLGFSPGALVRRARRIAFWVAALLVSVVAGVRYAWEHYQGHMVLALLVSLGLVVLYLLAGRDAQPVAAPAELIDRDAVWYRDRGICYIGGEVTTPNAWHLEHTIPTSRGGPHAYWNVGVACPSCNLRKGAADPRTDKRWKHLMNAIPQREARRGLIAEFLSSRAA